MTCTIYCHKSNTVIAHFDNIIYQDWACSDSEDYDICGESVEDNIMFTLCDFFGNVKYVVQY